MKHVEAISIRPSVNIRNVLLRNFDQAASLAPRETLDEDLNTFDGVDDDINKQSPFRGRGCPRYFCRKRVSCDRL
jgi:hypothetical protein